MQNIKGNLKSINGSVDVFENNSPFNTDHVWPESKGGTNTDLNKLKLSQTTNDDKKDLTTGEINGFRFSVEKSITKKNDNGEQSVYGTLYIKKENSWYKVVNG